jgi:hypothetical protein
MTEFQDRHYPIQEDMRFQRRSWLVERVGWAVLGIVLLAALGGAFGYGALSTRSTGGPTLRADYERFQRVSKVARYVIHLGPAGGEREITLGPQFHSTYEVADIEPKPVSSTAKPDGLSLRFAASNGDLLVVIWARPHRFGPARLELTSGAEHLSLWTLVYP